LYLTAIIEPETMPPLAQLADGVVEHQGSLAQD
jgi:hypothetical protein